MTGGKKPKPVWTNNIVKYQNMRTKQKKTLQTSRQKKKCMESEIIMASASQLSDKKGEENGAMPSTFWGEINSNW